MSGQIKSLIKFDKSHSLPVIPAFVVIFTKLMGALVKLLYAPFGSLILLLQLLRGILEILALIFLWYMFIELVFLLIPKIFSSHENSPEIVTENYIVVRTAIITVLVAFFFSIGTTKHPKWLSDLLSSLIPFAIFIIVFLSILIGKHIYFRELRRLPPEKRIEFVERLVPGGRMFTEEDREKLKQERLAFVFFPMISSVILLVVSISVGVAIGLMSQLSPIPEIIIIVTWLSATQPEINIDKAHILRERLESFKKRVYELPKYQLNSLKGNLSIFLLLWSIGTAMAFTSLSFVVAAELVASSPFLFYSFLTHPMKTWNALGFALCILTPGLYAMWFWLRETLRLPSYFMRWEQRWNSSATLVENIDFQNRVARPPDNLLAPTVLWIPVIVMVRDGSNLVSPSAPICRFVVPGQCLIRTVNEFSLFDWPMWVTNPKFHQFPGEKGLELSILWPILFGFVLLLVGWTRKKDSNPQDPYSDGFALAIAAVLQLSWIWVFLLLSSRGFVVPFLDTLFLFAFLILYFLPEIEGTES